ncbi:MAG: enoyl-CoA hydratase/isomerase family protein, partial [Proteobacteria bacterium]|nr:enoyl-CoA hydratase/isomerase family protein [Pseudomonadota bacterium]
MSDYQTIEFEQSDETVTIVLNRPKLNLVNAQMITELIDAFHSLRNNPSARFVIVTAQGDHFSAGIDMKEIDKTDFTPEDARIQQLNGHEMMRSLENLEQVTVAALRGIVCGAGMALAQACDFRIMSEDSFYLVPETNIGT